MGSYPVAVLALGRGQPWHPSWGSGPQCYGHGAVGTPCARAHKEILEYVLQWSQSPLGCGLVMTKPRPPPETETVSALSKQLS